MAAGALALILGWALFALGAFYPWASRPAIVAVCLLCAIARPSILRPDARLLDAALLLTMAIGVLQLVPLPPWLHDTLSPASRAFLTATAIVPSPASAWLPLTLAPQRTRDAVGLLIAAVLVFWVTRESMHSRGVRTLARAVSWFGLLAALLALTSAKLFSNGKIYGLWSPGGHVEIRPAGPIINRNHFAAWMILGLSITAGYLFAHARSHWTSGRRHALARMLSDTRSFWLVAACGLMSASLILTQSRSGVIGCAVALAVALTRGWRRLGAAGRACLVLYVLVLVGATVLWSSPENVAARLNQSVNDSWGGRPEIWALSGRIARDYPISGVGLDAFALVMSVYQPLPRPAVINQAHNQYLQVFVEGGLLMVVPLLVACVAFFRLAIHRLRGDTSVLVHLREGALAGLLGVAVESVWETPLLTPAVFLLAAMAAGLVVHRRRDDEAGA